MVGLRPLEPPIGVRVPASQSSQFAILDFRFAIEYEQAAFTGGFCFGPKLGSLGRQIWRAGDAAVIAFAFGFVGRNELGGLRGLELRGPTAIGTMVNKRFLIADNGWQRRAFGRVARGGFAYRATVKAG